MKDFADAYETFESWLKDRVWTPFTKRIVRGHQKYPKASLSELRGHPKKGEKGLAKTKPKPVRQRSWSALSPKEKATREKALDVVSDMRRSGKSLTRASKERGISPETVRRHTKAVTKDGRRWRAKRYDKIPRVWKIYEDGDVKTIEVDDSRHASTIGEYHNAVKNFLRTNDESYLMPYRGKKIRDSSGNMHELETDPKVLYEIQEKIPDIEFFEVYNFD